MNSSKYLRILQVNPYNFGVGGLSTIVYNWGSNMPDDIIFDYFCEGTIPIKRYKEILIENGSYIHEPKYSVNSKFKRIMNYLIRFKKVIKDYPYECIHIHSDRSFGILKVAVVAKLLGIKHIIAHSHSVALPKSKMYKFWFALHYFSKIFLPLFVTDFFSCSNEAADWMYPKSVSSKVVIIKNGVDVSKYSYDNEIRNCIRQEMKLDGLFVIGHIGRFDYPKNHPFLIRLFYEYQLENPMSRLLLVGDGKDMEAIKDLIRELRICEKVIFTGNSQIAHKLLQAMDIFVLPSWYEGFPVVGVEAQCSGLPIIFSDRITKNAKVSENVNFLSLDEGFLKWVECIRKYEDFNRVKTDTQIAEYGFDNNVIGKELGEYYRNLLK